MSVLIVDDVVGNIRLIEALLAPDGHAVRTAANGADALRQIDLEPPDLVLAMTIEVQVYAEADHSDHPDR